MLLIPAEILAHIRRHAAADYPRECCGILIGHTRSGEIEIIESLPAKNLADPARLHDRYTIDPLAILHADRHAASQSRDILGFYHSHPDHPPVPSPTDLVAAWPHYFYLILTITAAGPGEIRAWQLPPDPGPMREIAIHPCLPQSNPRE